MQKADASFPSITSIISFDSRVTAKGSRIFLSPISWIKIPFIMVRRDIVQPSKVQQQKNRTICEFDSKLTIKTPERRYFVLVASSRCFCC